MLNKSKIETINGIPHLFINNKLVQTDSYICYYSNNNRYRDFTKIGVNLFFINVFFATRSINEDTGFQPFLDGIFDSEKGFKAFDEEIDKILEVNPNAFVIPRVNVSLPLSFETKNKEELNDTGIFYLKDNEPRICFSSDLYFNEVKKYLKKFIDYVKSSKYEKNIVGFQISEGKTQEWMPFDYNGSQGIRSREKFESLVSSGLYKNDIHDYRQFLSDICAQRICELCSYVKELTNNEIVVGSFYGYSYVLCGWRFCHAALNKILNSNAVDFLAAPLSYWTNRSLIEDNPRMLPSMSILKHNKLYFAENDTRTDLSKAPCDLPAYLNNPIWYQNGRENSLESLKMHYAISLCGGHAFWWFDMWGGWYDDPEFMELHQKFFNISKDALNHDVSSLNEVALIIDEEAFSYFEIDDEKINFDVCRNSLKEIGKAAVSYDGFLASDFDLIKDKYKTFILLNSVETKRIKTIKEYFSKKNIKYLEINRSNYKIKASEIRDFYKRSGVKPRFDFDAVVYENHDYLYVHTVKESILENPYDFELVPLYDKQSFPIKSKAGKGYLFRKINDYE